MKVYIRQKIFTTGYKYTVYNEHEEPIISVTGKVFSDGKKLHIYDKSDNEIFYVEQPLYTAEYRVYQNNIQVASINRSSLLNYDVDIDSVFGDFKIKGSFLSYNFKIYQDKKLIGTVLKKFFSFGDCYVLDKIKTDNIEFLVTLVIVINQIFHKYEGYNGD